MCQNCMAEYYARSFSIIFKVFFNQAYERKNQSILVSPRFKSF